MGARINENNHSVITTQRAFPLYFGIARAKSVSSANSIKFWIRQWKEMGSILNGCSHGASRTTRTPENVQLVRETVDRSLRRRRLLWKSRIVLWEEVIHEDLLFHPYKLMMVQEFNITSYGNYKNICREVLQQILSTTTFFCSYKAHFHLSGTVNKQNFRYWAEKHPRQFYEKPPHSFKVTV